MSRCKCHLEIVDGPTGAAKRGEAPQDISQPHGSSNPPAQAQAQLDDARSRVNYWRRAIDDAADGSHAEAEAIRERQKANDEIIDLQFRHGLRDVPLLSVGDVLGERDLGRDAVGELLDRGISSASLDAMSTHDRTGKVDDLKRAVEQFLAARAQRAR